MEKYYPTNTKKYSTEPLRPPYQINILNITTNIRAEVHRELSAHYHWIQHDMACTLPQKIETCLCNHPDYSNWAEPNLTKEYLPTGLRIPTIIHSPATPNLESIKIGIPGERASPALVAMRSHLVPDASEEEKRAKIVEGERLGISNHRVQVTAYMHLSSDRVAEVRGKMRKAEEKAA